MEENTVRPKKKSKKGRYISILAVIITVVIVIIVIFLMNGETKTTGNYPGDATTESLKCVGKNMPYKFFTKDNPSSAEIKINAIFNQDKIDSISLIHRTTYDNEADAETNSNIHKGDMNINFQNKGMKPFSLGAAYSLDKKVAQMSLYATSNELNDDTIKYFMLESLPKDLNGYKKGYTSQGFKCEITK